MKLRNRKIVMFISMWMIAAGAIAQDEWHTTKQTQIDEKDVRIETVFKIDTAKQSFEIKAKIFSGDKNRPLERKLERLTANNIRLAGTEEKPTGSELIKDSSILGGIHLKGKFSKVDPKAKSMLCYIVLNYGKKEESIELNYNIPIIDKEKDRENSKKILEEKRKTDSITNAMRIKAEEDAAEEKRLEEEDRKAKQKQNFQSLNNQLANIDKEKQAIEAIQSAYNSFQQEVAASTPEQPGKVLGLQDRLKKQQIELSRLLTQLQAPKTDAAALATALLATEFKNFHNKDQFISLQQSNGAVQKNIGVLETSIQQLQSKFKELLGRQIFDSKVLDSTAEGKIYKALSPVTDALNTMFSKLDDSLSATMKFVNTVGKQQKGIYSCDSLWKLYDLFLDRREKIIKQVTAGRELYQKKLKEFKAVLKTGKVDAVEQQLADLEKYSNSIEKKNKDLGTQLNGIDCKPATKTRLPLFILGGAVSLVLMIIILIRYRKKRAESQIKFLN